VGGFSAGMTLADITPDLVTFLGEKQASSWIGIVDTGSMYPLLQDNDEVLVRFGRLSGLRPGDLALFRDAGTGYLFVHRVLKTFPDGAVRQAGDALLPGGRVSQSIVPVGDVLGRVRMFRKNGRQGIRLGSILVRVVARVLAWAQQAAQVWEQRAEDASPTRWVISHAAHGFFVYGPRYFSLAVLTVLLRRPMPRFHSRANSPLQRAGFDLYEEGSSVRYRLGPETQIFEVDGRMVLVRAKTSVGLLNETGRELVQLIAKGNERIPDLLKVLTTQGYHLPKEAVGDITAYLQDLVSTGFLQTEKDH